MDRTQFISSEFTWWLNADGLEFNTAELRKDVGSHLGWDRGSQWYLEPSRLEELYYLLEARSPELLREVDEATDDVRRQAWMQKLVDLVNPASSKEQGAVSGEPGQSGAVSAKETQTSREPTATTSARAKPSPFGSAKRADAVAEGSPATSTQTKPSPFGSARRADAGTDASPATKTPAKPSPFGSANRANAAAKSPAEGGEIAKELESLVNDLAPLVANAVAAVPGAEALSAQELSEVVSEVLAGK
jgi:hypothetical protein